MLIDRFNRKIDYLRISITDRCNLRCVYCSPQERFNWLPREDILTYEEIIKIIKVAQTLGIRKFRFTGGEPLLREGIINFLKKCALLGLNYSLTTNGILLNKYAQNLFDLGLEKINISLDTLNENKFSKITGQNKLKDILLGIEKAEKVGFSSVKINVVIMKDINDDEIENFINFSDNRHIVRFIEFMPFMAKDYYLSLSEVERKIKENGALKAEVAGAGPARYYKVGKHIVGFVTPGSKPFCHQCNRLRLTSDGKLRPCLASREVLNIKNILRQVKNGKEKVGLLRDTLIDAVNKKPKGHNFEFRGEMAKIGG